MNEIDNGTQLFMGHTIIIIITFHGSSSCNSSISSKSSSVTELSFEILTETIGNDQYLVNHPSNAEAPSVKITTMQRFLKNI